VCLRKHLCQSRAQAAGRTGDKSDFFCHIVCSLCAVNL
jgi:hypothetical protein